MLPRLLRQPIAPPAALPFAEQPVEALLVEQPPQTALPHSPVAESPFAPPPIPAARHPLDPSPPVVVAAPQASLKPARSLADVLQSFMEESNIRWGEILAALLIVTSAVGLVISLRATLKAIPYFPALLFTLFTVAFHGAGCTPSAAGSCKPSAA